MTDFTRGFIAGLEAAAGFADYMGGDRYKRPSPTYNRRDKHASVERMIEAQHLRAHTLAVIYRKRAAELADGLDEARIQKTKALDAE